MPDVDRETPTWRAIEQWALAEIEKARDRLENWSNAPHDNDMARGEIRALRHLLALGKPPAPTFPPHASRAYTDM